MTVDVHAHCYPKAYVKELIRTGVGEDGGFGTQIIEWSSSEEMIEKMDELGVDIQVLSLSAPNVYFPDAELSKSLAQMTNDFISDICKKYPDRFMCFASIPLNNLNYAFDELDRTINHLGMDGVVLGTNINQKSLSEDQFLPFFEELDRRKIVICLHPVRPIGEDLMPTEDRKLNTTSIVGFVFETTRTIASMAFKGTFEKYKNLIFILPHSGGAIPFLYPRWDNKYLTRSSSHELRKIPNVPSFYLKRHYYDTALSYYPSSLRCTVDFAGIDHILFGTDSPFTMIDFRAKETLEKIENYGFSSQEKEKIYIRNAVTLFPKLENAMLHKR